jgi:hypothetical protein
MGIHMSLSDDTQTNPIDPVEQVVRDFQIQLTAHNKSDKQEKESFTTARDTRERELIQRAFQIAVDLLEHTDIAALIAAFDFRQIPTPDVTAGENPFRPIVRMLYGRFDEKAPKVSYGNLTGLTKFVRNPSAERYAGVLRYLDEEQVQPQDVAHFIAKFEEPPFGKNIIGIIKHDRERHPDKPPVDKKAMLARASRDTPLAVIDLPEDYLDMSGPVGLWGEFKNGKMLVRGMLSVANKQAEAAAVSRGQELSALDAKAEAAAKNDGRYREMALKFRRKTQSEKITES